MYLVFDYQANLRGDPNPLKAFQLHKKIINLIDKEKLSFNDIKTLSSKSDQLFIQIPLEIITNPISKVKMKYLR